jgi:hypothetical protein
MVTEIDVKICNAVTRSGEPCKAKALPNSDRCFAHSTSAEERRANAQKAQRRKTMLERRKANPFYEHAELVKSRAFPLLYEAMRAEIREPGMPVQPDWTARLLALFVAIVITGAYEDDINAVYTQLDALIPEQLRPKPKPTMSELLRNARREWDRVKVQWSDVAGLIPEPYPEHMLDGMTQQQAQAEGAEHLRNIYGDPHEIPGLDTHIAATVIETGKDILIRRALNVPRANVIGA